MIERQQTTNVGLPWRHILLSGAWLALASGYCIWSWGDELGDLRGDNAYYLLMAQQFSPWSQASEVTAYFATHNPYPPLYPLLLALTGGADSLLIAHLVTTACLLVALPVLYRWLRLLSVPGIPAALTTLVFALLPGTLMQALAILSENLYLLFSLLALAGASAHEVGRRHASLWMAAACVAAATLTRSAGIALLIAFVPYVLVSRPPRFAALIALAAAPLVVWQVFHGQQLGYLTILEEQQRSGVFARGFDHLGVQAGALWWGWVENFSGSRVAVPVTTTLAAAALVAAGWRAVAGKLDGYYVVLYLLVILAWPFPGEAQRFVYVIAPVLLVQLLVLVHHAAARVPRWRIVAMLFPAALAAVVALPEVALAAGRFMHPLPPELEGFRRDREWYLQPPSEARAWLMMQKAVIEGLRDIPGSVPEDACLYAIKPAVAGYYGRRIAIPPPREHLEAAAFDAQLRRSGCRYIFAMGFRSATYRTAFYPLDRAATRLQPLRLTLVPEGRQIASVLAELHE